MHFKRNVNLRKPIDTELKILSLRWTQSNFEWNYWIYWSFSVAEFSGSIIQGSTGGFVGETEFDVLSLFKLEALSEVDD